MNIIEAMQRAKPGSWIADGNHGIWLVPEPDEHSHLTTETVFSLFSGKMTHISKLPEPLKFVTAYEVTW